MKKLSRILAIGTMAAVIGLSANTAMAQDNGGRQRGGGNFDPAQMRQRMMERYKEMLEIANDDEWKAIEPLVTKVSEARLQSMQGMGRGFFGRPRGGDNQGNQGDRQERRGGPGGMFGQPDPTAEALDKAVQAKASKAELKAALTKYQEARKAKEAQLKEAQENLRKVLTARQEAIATLNGLL